VKINVDHHRRLAQKFNVRSITWIFFLDGNEIKDKSADLILIVVQKSNATVRIVALLFFFQMQLLYK